MSLDPSEWAGVYSGGAAAPTPDPFSSPGTPTPGTVGAVGAVTSNALVGASAGDKLLMLVGHFRGSISSPTSALRSVTEIVGTADYSTLSLTGATIMLETSHRQRFDANPSGAGVEVLAYMATLPAGDGDFDVTFSGTVFGAIAQAWVLPACTVVDTVAGGATNAQTSIALTTGATLGANDLAFSAMAHQYNTGLAVPSGYTEAANYTSSTNDRFMHAWKNGTLSATTTWASLRNDVPAAALKIILRRT